MNIATRAAQVVYHFIVQIRNYFYHHGLLRVEEVRVPIVSVGNITFGGTGKTPMVIWMAREIQKAGFRVAIISRGYKRRSYFTRVVSTPGKIRMSRRRAGDEPYLMAFKLKGIPVIVSRKRVKGASKAVNRFKPDIILLDDGFQHRKIGRKVDIVLLDSPEIIHNNTLLREPLKNLRRADAIVFTKYDYFENAAEIHREMVKLFSCPVFHARYNPQCIKNETEELPTATLNGKTVWLIAGIDKPDYFKHTVEQLGSYVSRTFFFRDHARYTRWRTRSIITKFESSSADYLITTEKDWHKLKRWILPGVPCYYLDIDIDINRAPLLLKLIYDATYLQKVVDVVE